MSEQFDRIIDRQNTKSVKWDTCGELFQSLDVLPMWIADMDFRVPAPVLDSMKEVLEKGILGYSYPCPSLFEAIINWQRESRKLELTREDILFSPGVVSSLALSVQSFTKKGEAVMVHDPVYPPFSSMIETNERKLIRSSLKIKNGQYQMDFQEMEEKFVREKVRLLFLCHPHNPGGRVWSSFELSQLMELCQKHHVLVISDEIHSDLVYPGIDFISPVTLKEEYKQSVITLTSVTKTFNLAGIKNSMIFVLDPFLREKMQLVQAKIEMDQINTFGYIGTESALCYGKPWLNELMDYLDETKTMVCHFFDQHLPHVFYMVPEATYLFWFDASSLGIPDEDLKIYFADIGKIGLNDGGAYGPSGTQFMRLNFAAPRPVVQEGLERIKKVFESKKQTVE